MAEVKPVGRARSIVGDRSGLGLAWSGSGSVWSDMVWSGLGLPWSGSGLVWLGLVWLGLVWYDLI